MARVDEHARLLLAQRANRLIRLLASDAPDGMISFEASLINEAGMLLDPEGYVRREVERATAKARRHLGLCADRECDEVLESGSRLCPEHEAAQDLADLLAEGTKA